MAVNLEVEAVLPGLDTVVARQQRRVVLPVIHVSRSRPAEMEVISPVNRTSETVRAVNWHHQTSGFLMGMVHQMAAGETSRRGQ